MSIIHSFNLNESNYLESAHRNNFIEQTKPINIEVHSHVIDDLLHKKYGILDKFDENMLNLKSYKELNRIEVGYLTSIADYLPSLPIELFPNYDFSIPLKTLPIYHDEDRNLISLSYQPETQYRTNGTVYFVGQLNDGRVHNPLFVVNVDDHGICGYYRPNMDGVDLSYDNHQFYVKIGDETLYFDKYIRSNVELIYRRDIVSQNHINMYDGSVLTISIVAGLDNLYLTMDFTNGDINEFNISRLYLDTKSSYDKTKKILNMMFGGDIIKVPQITVLRETTEIFSDEVAVISTILDISGDKPAYKYVLDYKSNSGEVNSVELVVDENSGYRSDRKCIWYDNEFIHCQLDATRTDITHALILVSKEPISLPSDIAEIFNGAPTAPSAVLNHNRPWTLFVNPTEVTTIKQ